MRSLNDTSLSSWGASRGSVAFSTREYWHGGRTGVLQMLPSGPTAMPFWKRTKQARADVCCLRQSRKRLFGQCVSSVCDSSSHIRTSTYLITAHRYSQHVHVLPMVLHVRLLFKNITVTGQLERCKLAHFVSVEYSVCV
jgi:hypothetical protein